MSHTQKKRRASHTRYARRSLVELTAAAASRAADDGLLVLLDSLTAASPNDPPRLEHAAERPDHTAVASHCVELAGSDSAAEMVVKIAKAYQNSGADAVELIVQKEPADSAGQPQPRYMRRLTDEAVRLLDDLRSGKLENQANFILSECFREAASAFSMINQQLKRDGYAASIDPSIFIWLANITEPETRDTGTMRLEIVPNHQCRPSTYARQVAQFIWHLVEGQGCRRQAAYRGASTKFTVSASFAEKAYAFWEPIFKRAGPHVKMLTRISDPEM